MSHYSNKAVASQILDRLKTIELKLKKQSQPLSTNYQYQFQW